MSGPVLADLRHLEVDGTFSPDHTSQSYEIPVGPLTTSLRLGVSTPGAPNPSELPVFTQLSFVNPAGAHGAAGPAWSQDPGAPEDLIVLLRDAPAGANLLVQIGAAGPSGTPAGTTNVPGPSSNWTVPYVLNVERQDAQGSARQLVPAAQGSVSVGALVFAATSPVGYSSLSPTSVAAPDVTGAATSKKEQAVTASSGLVANQSVVDLPDGSGVGVSTGPLASRSAGPLGPLLAASDSDPAPPVDRHERALSHEIDAALSDDGSCETEWHSELARHGSTTISPVETGGSASSSTGGTVVAVSHGGGFPLMVTALGHGRRTDRAALLATVPSTPAVYVPEPQASAVERSSDQAQLALVDQADSSSAHSQVSDYMKAVWALALGLALTSGPLFSDLLARMPTQWPGWLRKKIRRRREGEKRA
jgi:hypothetical protein